MRASASSSSSSSALSVLASRPRETVVTPALRNQTAAAATEESETTDTETDTESESDHRTYGGRQESEDLIAVLPQKRKRDPGAILLDSYGDMRYLCYLFAKALRSRRSRLESDSFDIETANFQQRINIALDLDSQRSIVKVRLIYVRAGLAKEWAEKLYPTRRSRHGGVASQLQNDERISCQTVQQENLLVTWIKQHDALSAE